MNTNTAAQEIMKADPVMLLRREWNKSQPIRPFVFRVARGYKVRKGHRVSVNAVIYKVLEKRDSLVLCVPNAAPASMIGLYSTTWPEGEPIIEGTAYRYWLKSVRKKGGKKYEHRGKAPVAGKERRPA